MKKHKKQDDYQTVFEYVRKIFFPRWDREGEWQVIVLEDVNGATARTCYR